MDDKDQQVPQEGQDDLPLPGGSRARRPPRGTPGSYIDETDEEMEESIKEALEAAIREQRGQTDH